MGLIEWMSPMSGAVVMTSRSLRKGPPFGCLKQAPAIFGLLPLPIPRTHGQRGNGVSSSQNRTRRSEKPNSLFGGLAWETKKGKEKEESPLEDLKNSIARQVGYRATEKGALSSGGGGPTTEGIIAQNVNSMARIPRGRPRNGPKHPSDGRWHTR